SPSRPPAAAHLAQEAMVPTLLACPERQVVNRGEFQRVRPVVLSDGFLQPTVVLVFSRSGGIGEVGDGIRHQFREQEAPLAREVLGETAVGLDQKSVVGGVATLVSIL